MKSFSSLIIAIAIVLLSGCGSPHDNAGLASLNQENVEQIIVRGQTREAELIRRFGRPETVSAAVGGGRTLGWASQATRITPAAFIPFANLAPGAIGVEVKSLSITLNRSGVVSDFTFSSRADGM